MTVEEVRQLAKARLTPYRYTHEKNVAELAVRLANQYGANPEKAALASWLHDITKEESTEEMLQLLRQDAIIAGSIQNKPKPVWHGPCAAVFAKYQLGIEDPEVLNAVACHTTGKPGMQKLDKILYVADMISPERTFKGVEQLRSLAFQNLDDAVLQILRTTVAHVKERGGVLDEESMLALRDMEQQVAGKCT